MKLSAYQVQAGHTQAIRQANGTTELFCLSGRYHVKSSHLGRILTIRNLGLFADAQTEYRAQVRQIRTGGLY